MELIDEIGIDYAEANGGGLPLTAKEYCNALALWVQQMFDNGFTPKERKKYVHKIECIDYAEYEEGYGHRITFAFISDTAVEYNGRTFPWDKLIYGTNVFVEYYSRDGGIESYNGIIIKTDETDDDEISRNVHIVSYKGKEILPVVRYAPDFQDTVTEIQ